ncbi:hypothetical protein KKG41_03465 [Patescibacteria group bacterium]|nr:hypothetical protein [Patescibacteria group bacterium]MBU1890226.1 hypothetical protein [Patescibacteria group bacterium]
MSQQTRSVSFWISVVFLFLHAIWWNFTRGKRKQYALAWVLLFLFLSLGLVQSTGISISLLLVIVPGALAFFLGFPTFVWLGDGHPFPMKLVKDGN